MTIIRAQHTSYIPLIRPLVEAINRPDKTEDIMSKLKEYITIPAGLVLLNESSSSTYTALLFAYHTIIQDINCVIIYAAFNTDKDKLLPHEMFARVHEFARIGKAKRILMETLRNPAAFIRKYKFTLDGYLLSKEV